MAKKLPTHKTSVDICNEALDKLVEMYSKADVLSNTRIMQILTAPPIVPGGMCQPHRPEVLRKHVDSREVTVRALPEK